MRSNSLSRYTENIVTDPAGNGNQASDVFTRTIVSELPTPSVLSLAFDGPILLYEGQDISGVIRADPAPLVPIPLNWGNTDASLAGQLGTLPTEFPAGATELPFSVVVPENDDSEPLVIGDLALEFDNGSGEPVQTPPIRIEVRDDDPTPGVALAIVPLQHGIPVECRVGDYVPLVIGGGQGPFIFDAGTDDCFIEAGLISAGVYEVPGFGDALVRVQRVLYRPSQTGSNTITVRDATGATASIAVNVAAAPVASLASPRVPLSLADTVYRGVGGGNSGGVEELLRLAAEIPENELRIGAWDAATQRFVELPDEPIGCLTPYHGLFIASRSAISWPAGGDAGELPLGFVLQPKWNFIAIPNLAGVDSLRIADALLSDESGAVVVPEMREVLLNGLPQQWDGQRYVPVEALVPGEAYWIYNTTIDPPQTLQLTWSPVTESAGVVASAVAAQGVVHAGTAGHRTAAPRGGPPTPDGQSSGTIGTRQAASDGNGGCGIGVGLFVADAAPDPDLPSCAVGAVNSLLVVKPCSRAGCRVARSRFGSNRRGRRCHADHQRRQWR